MKDVWIVKRNTCHLRVTQPYEVFLDGFRDSSHYNKYEAQQRCDQLNFLEEMDFWNLSMEDQTELLLMINEEY